MIVISDVSGVDEHLNKTNPHQIQVPVVPPFATTAEMNNGTSTASIVTPAELKKYFASNQPAAPNIPNFASNTEIDAGVSTDTIIHPAGLKRYVEDQMPEVPEVPEFANSSEISQGTSTDKIVNPRELKRYVDENQPPIIEFASAAQINAGTSETTMVNPKELKRYVEDNQPEIPEVPAFANTSLVNQGTSTTTIVNPAELKKYVDAQKPTLPKFATTGQVDAGVSTDTMINPQQLKRFVESNIPEVPEFPEFASPAIVNAGTSTDTIINPQQLKRVLDTSIPSVPSFASATQVAQGTSTTTMVNPKELADYVDEKIPFIPNFATQNQILAANQSNVMVSPIGLKQYFEANMPDVPEVPEKATYATATDTTNDSVYMTPRWVNNVKTSEAKSSEMAASSLQLKGNVYVSPRRLRDELGRLKVSPFHSLYGEGDKKFYPIMVGNDSANFPGYKVETVSLDLNLWMRHIQNHWNLFTTDIQDNYDSRNNFNRDEPLMDGEIHLSVWAKEGLNFRRTKIANTLGSTTNYFELFARSNGTRAGGVGIRNEVLPDDDFLEESNRINDTYEFQVQITDYHSPAHENGSTRLITGVDTVGKISGRLKNAQTNNGHLGVEDDPDNKYPIQFGLWTNRIKESIVFGASSEIGNVESYTRLNVLIKIRNARTSKFICSYRFELNLNLR